MYSNRMIFRLLRIAVAACFIGHGAFGIIGKAAWLPYFAVARIPESLAWTLMPVIGTFDIAIGVLALVRPMWAGFAWAAAWTLWTASLRPLAGESIWELLERAGNYGVPLAILLWAGRPRSLRAAFARMQAPPMDDRAARILHRTLVVTTALLLIGHGGFGLFEQKPLLASHYAAFGAGPAAVPFIGMFELLLACIVLLRPGSDVLFAAVAWKVTSELLHPITGAPIWEFIERGGSYFAPLIAGLLARTDSVASRTPAISRTATAALLCIVLLPAATPRPTQLRTLREFPPPPLSVPSDSLIAKLRYGGHVLLCRHAITDRSRPDARRVDYAERSTQRNLSDAGVRQARELGEQLRRLAIPVGEVLASPYFRTMESGELAFGRVTAHDDLAFAGDDDAFRTLLSAPPADGVNRILISHAGRIFRVIARSDAGPLEEGDCIVVEPRKDSFEVLGHIGADEWASLR